MLMIAYESMSHTLQSALSPADNNTNKHKPARFCGMLDWKLQFSFALKILYALGAVNVFAVASTKCLRRC